MNPEELVQVNSKLLPLGDIQKSLPLAAENRDEARMNNRGFHEKPPTKTLLKKVARCFGSTNKKDRFNKSGKLQIEKEILAEPVPDQTVYEKGANKNQCSQNTKKGNTINDQQKWRDLAEEYLHRKGEMPYLRKTEHLQNKAPNTIQTIPQEKFSGLQGPVLQKTATVMARGYDHRKKKMPHLQKVEHAGPLRNGVVTNITQTKPQESFHSLKGAVSPGKWSDIVREYRHRIKEMPHLRNTECAGPLQDNVAKTTETICQESFPSLEQVVLQEKSSHLARGYDRTKKETHLWKTERVVPLENNFSNTVATISQASFPGLPNTVPQKKWSDVVRENYHRKEEMLHLQETEHAVPLPNNIDNPMETILQESFRRIPGKVPQKKWCDLGQGCEHRKEEEPYLSKIKGAVPVQNSVVTDRMETISQEYVLGAKLGSGTNKDQQKWRNQAQGYDIRKDEMQQLKKTGCAEALQHTVSKKNAEQKSIVPRKKHWRNQPQELKQKGRKVF